MGPHEPTVEELIREAEEARIREVLVEAAGEELLDRARDVSRTIEKRVRQVTTPEMERWMLAR
jgi:hypothetical protein